MSGATVLLVLLFLVVGLLLGAVFGVLWSRGRDGAALARVTAERDAAEDRVVELTQERATVGQQMGGQAVVKEALDRLHAQLNQLEQGRAAWQSQLHQQVNEVRMSGEALRRETASLSTALRKPQVRGRWGELHLRRTVELAGMVAHCDFTEQTTTSGEDGLLRPDLVVRLAEGKNLVVDSKVPLAAFLEAAESDDADFREERLRAHARHLRTHVDQLAAKAYWTRLSPTPEFVILFVPGESFLSAALDIEPALLEYAAERRVILATPTTLIATLRAAAYAWNQSALTESAQQVFELGRELYDRLSVMGDHLGRVGRSLTSAVEAYNGTVGSFERRVFITARKLRDLHVTEAELTAMESIEASVRPLTAPEFLAIEEPEPVRHWPTGEGWPSGDSRAV
ncbi:DNA recombination protein RmuC [Kribbella sandramycini]|uniref:DNA recombination protein RmuC n=1 Tax=Kribbella sandramycini TaxID=60450 RepID=A0A841SQ84_9ACTN|nr:DNA recombination protein RmuC [Kribbella sandramycini]MBB6571435.1 DNA recombination protein RmuC [Kribbella sandramycini]